MRRSDGAPRDHILEGHGGTDEPLAKAMPERRGLRDVRSRSEFSRWRRSQRQSAMRPSAISSVLPRPLNPHEQGAMMSHQSSAYPRPEIVVGVRGGQRDDEKLLRRNATRNAIVETRRSEG